MTEPTMDDFVVRLDQLQRKNRRLKWLITALLTVGAIVIAIDYNLPQGRPLLPPLVVSLDYWDAGFVSGKGTWTSFGGEMGFPVQTSEIKCSKDMGYCLESTATFRDGFLNVSLDMHEIDRWDQYQITTKTETGLCGTSNPMQINRPTKSLTSIIVYTNKRDAICKDFPAELHHVLVSGTEAMSRLK
jgi:hypothetical protein